MSLYDRDGNKVFSPKTKSKGKAALIVSKVVGAAGAGIRASRQADAKARANALARGPAPPSYTQTPAPSSYTQKTRNSEA